MSHPFRSMHIEYHILQSFPVTCLNRDDVGAPKTAVVGGVTRARVSSQCWKRQVRQELRNLGIKLGVRTKRLENMLAEACKTLGAPEEKALQCGQAFAKELADDTLFFFSSKEATAFADYAKSLAFDAAKIKGKEIAKIAKKSLCPAQDGLDIALFGRMVAKAAEMNVEAAASFAHAISTHKTSNEVEFFTALDDLQEEPGSAHMGSLEFLLYYLVTGTLAGVFSFFVYILTGNALVFLMGASGAVFAVQLAYAAFFPRSIIYLWGILPLRAPVLVLGFASLEVFFLLTGSRGNVAHITHLAGFAFGWLYFVFRFGISPWRAMRR